MDHRRPAVLAALLALVATTGVPVVAQSVPAFGLAFSGYRDGSFDIVSIAVTAPSEEPLVQGTGDQHDPAWSPNGSRIAFSRESRESSAIVVARADGSGQGMVTSGPARDRQPDWGPGGDRLVFVRSSSWNGTSRIYRVQADGTGLTALTHGGSKRLDTAPAWSPDGTRIAFASARRGRLPDIYVMKPDGTNVRRLTRSRVAEANPSWSPGGTRILFERCCPRGSSDLMVMNAGGGGMVNLTGSPENEHDPAWSPDGDRIAFVRYAARGGNRDIFTMAPDGSSVLRVTSHRKTDLSPTWRPGPPCSIPTCIVAGGRSDSGLDEGSGDAVDDPRIGTAARAPAGGRVAQRSRGVGPGMRLILARHRRPLQRVFALKVNPRKQPSIDVALARGRLAGHQRTRRIARVHRARAAVNGDFALPSGSPVHAFLSDGKLKRTTLARGRNFAVSRNERRAFAGKPRLSVVLVQRGSRDSFPVDRWNDGAPVVGEIGAYTPAGIGAGAPPSGSCGARLVPKGPVRLSKNGRRLLREYKVRQPGCRAGRLARRGDVVLAAPPGTPEGLLAASLRAGSRVTVRTTFGWPGVVDSIGGTPMLVRGGRVVVGTCGASICGRHPRTAVGVTRNGRVLLVVVDGRRPGWSVGMSLRELAREMKRLGARNAVNLDGGGSSTMVLGRRVVNRPSDGSERAVSSAVLVLGRRDRTDPGTRAPSGSQPGGSPDDALLDPASTGGLLEALAEGTFGRPVDLPPSLQRVVRRLDRD